MRLEQHELDAIRARWAAATPGPWTVAVYDDVGAAVVQPGRGEFYLGLTTAGKPDTVDATAIAAAPVDVAALLAEVERLRERVRNAGEQVALNGCDCDPGDCDCDPADHFDDCSRQRCLACLVSDALHPDEES